MKKTIFSLFSLTVLVSAAAVAMGNNAAIAVPRDIPAELRLQVNDRYLGEKDAPVQIVEYASMTCSHCADFHKNVAAKLKKEYVETGKVRFTLRDLPWDNMAFAVAKIARCAPAEQHYSFVDAFFATRDNWIQADKPLDAIKKTARLGGMTPDAVDECLENEEIHAQIVAGKEVALEQLGVKGTPTVFINGKVLEGAHSYGAIKAEIEKILSGNE